MRQVLFFLVLFLCAGVLPLSAQYTAIRVDTATVSTTASAYGFSGLTKPLEMLGWYIYNSDATDTLLVNMNGGAPTSANAGWILPTKALTISYSGIRTLQIKMKSGSAVVHIWRIYRRER